MSDIVQELTIAAPMRDVFDAIALPEGITGWWANQVTGEVKPGSILEIRFDNGEVMKMEISDLVIGEKVTWEVRVAPHNWEGSTITWNLAPLENATRVLFGHANLTVAQNGYSIEQTRSGWEYFLESLKFYLEEGKGTPYVY